MPEMKFTFATKTLSSLPMQTNSVRELERGCFKQLKEQNVSELVRDTDELHRRGVLITGSLSGGESRSSRAFLSLGGTGR